MLAALVALVGLFVALYLTLYKLGYIGTIACAVGSCETVQTSKWATFLGFPVGAWGVGYYLTVLAISLAGLRPALAEHRGLSLLLVGLTGIGLLFSVWLTYLELFVIHAICQWCVVSAVLAAILFVIGWLDLREVTALLHESAAEAAEGLRAGRFGIKNTSEVAMEAVKEERR
jgi:uncharacterized membrane protein